MPKIGPVAEDVVNQVAGMARAGLQRMARPSLNSVMVRLMDLAIDGVGKLPSVKQMAAKHLEKRGNPELAIEAATQSHLLIAAAQGVVTNIGGLLSAIVGTPVNLTAVIVVQIRLVACVAHLRGYDIDDPRLRTAIAMCLLGESELRRQVQSGRLPSSPLAVATSPVMDPGLRVSVTDSVLNHSLTDAAGKGLITTLGRKTPVIGGGVGGIADWYGTRSVARCARGQFIDRRLAPITRYPQE